MALSGDLSAFADTTIVEARRVSCSHAAGNCVHMYVIAIEHMYTFACESSPG